MATQISPPSPVEPSSPSIPARRRFFHRTLSISDNFRFSRLPRYSFLGTETSEVDSEYPPQLPHIASDDSNGGDPEAAPGDDNAINAVIDTLPPSYDLASQPQDSTILGGGQISINPAQTPTEAPHIVHRYHIHNGFKNKPWATFCLFSHPPEAPQQKSQKLPRFLGGDDIKGVIELSLNGSQTVHSIDVTLRGRIITGSLDGEFYTFLNHRVCVWNRSFGDPRLVGKQPAKRFDGKLSGSYEFPFCFSFPTHVDIDTTYPVSFASNPSEAVSKPPLDPITSNTTSPTSPTSASSPSSPFSTSSLPSSMSPRSPALQIESPEHSPLPRSPPSSSRSFLMRSRRNKSIDHTHTPHSLHIPETVQEDPNATERARAQAQAQLESPALPAQQGGRLPQNISPIPQTFLERHIGVNVQYELGLVVTHGTFTPDSKVKTVIVYTPSVKPPVPSSLHQTGTPLPRPDVDPEGWYALPKLIIKGELLGERQVELGCTLSLAKPLCYARGTVIPCHLTITSVDMNALDLLAVPKSAPLVRLMRRVRYRQDSSAGPDSLEPTVRSSSFNGIGAGVLPMPVTRSHKRRASDPGTKNSVESGGMADVVEEMGVAKWSLKTKQDAEGSFRVLEGEIVLGKELQPSCGFALFNVQYTVDMLTFVSKLFEPNRQVVRGVVDQKADPRARVLLSQPVEIATLPYEVNTSMGRAVSSSS